MPIPALTYEALENELFCSIYYLRNLCNEAKFPEWNVTQPVKLLKECLEVIRSREGSSLSLECLNHASGSREGSSLILEV